MRLNTLKGYTLYLLKTFLFFKLSTPDPYLNHDPLRLLTDTQLGWRLLFFLFFMLEVKCGRGDLWLQGAAPLPRCDLSQTAHVTSIQHSSFASMNSLLETRLQLGLIARPELSMRPSLREPHKYLNSISGTLFLLFFFSGV